MTTEEILADQDARQAIESDLATTFLVEAAAGTGKTTSLLKRMVALLREGGARADCMATMTFTRKAAAHLRERFQLALEDAFRSETDELMQSRLALALRHMDRCFIGTIHSFCARLLRERPLEAGVDPDFMELTESEDLAIRRQCWQDYTQHLFVEDSPIPQLLESLGVNLGDLETAYRKMADYPDVTPTCSSLPKPDLDQALEKVSSFLDSVKEDLPRAAPEKGWDDLQDRLRLALRLTQILDLSPYPNRVRLLEALAYEGNVTKRRWPEGWRAAEIKTAYDKLRDTVVRPALGRWREYLHPFLVDVIRPALDDLSSRRLAAGQLNYQDLLISSRDLLRDHPRVRTYFQRRFTHFFVDEFQDTDPVQAEVILYLSSHNGHERDWRKLRPRPGALFMVGDPKQSIYRFRRADIATYDRVKEMIVGGGGGILQLKTNFRSISPICTRINEVFDEILPPSNTPVQAVNVHLVPHRGPGDPRCGIFRLEIPWAGKRRADQIAQEDAAKISKWLRWALDTGWQIFKEDGAGRSSTRRAEPADFMIILRNRSRLHLYARALESEGVPFEISGGRAFAESEELAALLPVLRGVEDPDSPLDIVAFLRGELCGVDDNALYQFHRTGGRFSYLTVPPDGSDPRIVEAFEFLRKAREQSRQLPPGAALAWIFESLGMIAYGAAREMGDTRSGNLLKALTSVRHISARGASFTEVVDHLTQLMDDREVEGMSVVPGRSEAVQIMNLHRAKGLEAPIVFLADPNTSRHAEPLFHIDRDRDKPEGHFLVSTNVGFYRHEIACPKDWEILVSTERAFQKAEEDRLLYVAATRAEQMLVVSIQHKRSKKPEENQVIGPWAKLSGALVRELPFPEALPEQAEIVADRESGDGLAEARRKIAKRRGTVLRPTYARAQVTAVAHSEIDPMPTVRPRGGGIQWGRVIHRFLEMIMREPTLDLNVCSARLLAEEGLPVDKRDEIVELAKNVQSSELWRRACRAEKRFFEVPFALTVPSADVSLEDGPSETILKGVIDLVFREAGTWVIVDYKSDDVGDDHTPLVARYAPQIRQYRRYWKQLTGEETTAAVFFVTSGRVEWVE